MFTITSDGVLERVQKNLESLPSWMPTIVRTHMDTLGAYAAERMREAVEPNRYTGTLSESITHDPDDEGYTQVIHPTAARGNWDAGALLETGTGPIPNAPWAPIQAWAEFRGLPGWPVLYKIRTVGVAAHPFLRRTLSAADAFITESARRIVSEMGRNIFYGGGKAGV